MISGSLSDIILDVLTTMVSSAQLAEYQCKVRAVFSFTLDGVNEQQVESLAVLAPLGTIMPHTFTHSCSCGRASGRK
jgi:hypothetical protein